MTKQRAWPAACALALALTLAACVSPDPLAEGPTSPTSPVAALELEPPVDRAYLPGIRDWRMIDERHLVLWQTPKRPFLVRLMQPLTIGAQSALTIGLKRSGSYLTRFDSIFIDGWQYGIDSIWEITREQADAVSGRKTTGG